MRSRFTVPGTLYRGVIYLRFDWDSVKQASGNILWRSVIIMLAGIALMGVLAYSLLYRTVLKPMAIIGAAMEHQKQGKEGVRVPALDNDEIGQLGMTLDYQPQVDLTTDRPCGVEVLLRWTNPMVGTVEPRTFIPAAESTGAIMHWSEWVLRQACRARPTKALDRLSA